MGWSAGRGRRGSRWRSARRATSSAAPGDRIKTDKRDAIRLARLFAAGDLRLVWIPSEEQEQLRDLVRCREDLRADLMRARHRLATFLLRRERYFPGPGGRWTLKHRHWLSQQHFDDQASRITYADYLHAHDVLLARRDRVGRELEQLAPDCVWAETIARLCCLRGISTLTALGLCAEIGDWRRFDHPDSIASYVGLVPSEHSSGQTRRLGKITKAGSTHARRLLVEAALHYRLTPSVGGKLAVRQRGHDPALIDHAWRVQRRLNARWNLLRNGRGKPAGDRDHRDRARARRRLLGDRHRPLNPTTSVWRVEAARRSGHSRTHERPRFRL